MQFARRLIFIAVLLMTTGGYIAAQDTPSETQLVEITASDDLILVGDYYTAADEGAKPAVLLMHMNNSQRSSWDDLIPALTEAGYNVLNVDLRGHGDTGGKKDWPLAITDVQTWLDWLRTQPDVRPDAVSIIGASIGSNLALVGCANDADCVTAIALSPGTDYFGVRPKDFVVDGLKDRSALLVASQKDGQSVEGVRQMVVLARGEIGVQLYAGGLHGTEILSASRFKERLTNLIVNWLNDHTPQAE